MTKRIDLITRVVEGLLILLWIVMVAAIFGQVVARYLFGKSLYWAEELGIYTMIWSCFLGTAIAARRGAHTRVSFFVNLLPPARQLAVEIFVNLLCAGWLCVVTWYAFKVAGTGFRNISTGLRLPLGYVYVSLPVSGVLMVVYLLAQSLESLRKLRSMKEGGEPA